MYWLLDPLGFPDLPRPQFRAANTAATPGTVNFDDIQGDILFV